MTISSTFNAGVSGLSANANQLSAISDNIANSATYGYKRAQTDFSAIVVHGGNGSIYTAGGVRTSTMRLIDERGPLIATSNPTDLAIDGPGFMAVTTAAAVNGSGGAYPVSLVTTGSFLPDANGVLMTQSGQVLMGWPADQDGVIPDYPRDTMSSLVPVTVNSSEYVANPTTQMTLGVNLPATSTEDGADGAPFSLSSEYYGNLSTSEALNYTFTPVLPAPGGTPTNTWTMTGSFNLPTEVPPTFLLYTGEVFKTWRYPELYNLTTGAWRAGPRPPDRPEAVAPAGQFLPPDQPQAEQGDREQ